MRALKPIVGLRAPQRSGEIGVGKVPYPTSPTAPACAIAISETVMNYSM